MSLYDKESETGMIRKAQWSAVNARITAANNAAHKARDPLDFYWKMGVQHLRDTFHKLLDFDPKADDFYNEGKYR
jgi:hypothetical protein